MFVLLWLLGLILLVSSAGYSVLRWCLVCLLGGYYSLFCGVWVCAGVTCVVVVNCYGYVLPGC